LVVILAVSIMCAVVPNKPPAGRLLVPKPGLSVPVCKHWIIDYQRRKASSHPLYPFPASETHHRPEQ